MTDVHGLQRRRERGRRAQAAFRNRKADQDRRLKAAIAKVIASTRGDESRDLVKSILNLAEVADLDKESEALAETAAALVVRTPSPPCLVSSTENYSRKNPSASFLSSRHDIRKQARTIWLDPLASSEPSLPPNDIVPYLGHGSTRFAGLILWSCMDHSQQHCQFPHSSPLELMQRSLSHCSTSRELDPLFVMDMVEARLQHKQHGQVSPRLTAAGEVDLGDVINGRIRMEYRDERGEDVDRQWLTCVALEDYVRDVVGREVFGLLEMGAAGEAGELVKGLMKGFKCRLWENCVCFGDGPRWHVDVVQGLVRMLMERALQGRQANCDCK